jgi:hypothetical protein
MEYFEDITRPLTDILPSPPYKEEMIAIEKFSITFNKLKQNIDRKQRVNALINAYYLGFIIDHSDICFNLNYRKHLTKHYREIVRATYDLFELNPRHILATKYLDVQKIRLIKKGELIQLRDKMLAFDGAQALEEEVVTIDPILEEILGSLEIPEGSS